METIGFLPRFSFAASIGIARRREDPLTCGLWVFTKRTNECKSHETPYDFFLFLLGRRGSSAVMSLLSITQGRCDPCKARFFMFVAPYIEERGRLKAAFFRAHNS